MDDPQTWSGRARNPGLAALGVLIAVGALIAVMADQTIMALAVFAAALIVTTSSKLAVEIDPEELRVRWGVFGWPVNRIALHRIDTVEAVAIRPLHAGGWGYRGSRVLFGRAAALVRRGPALRLTLEKGRVFIITVDDAASAATVLQTLVAKNR